MLCSAVPSPDRLDARLVGSRWTAPQALSHQVIITIILPRLRMTFPTWLSGPTEADVRRILPTGFSVALRGRASAPAVASHSTQRR